MMLATKTTLDEIARTICEISRDGGKQPGLPHAELKALSNVFRQEAALDELMSDAEGSVREYVIDRLCRHASALILEGMLRQHRHDMQADRV
jgi:hypothetical protein